MKRILLVLLSAILLTACEPVDGDECDRESDIDYCDGNTAFGCVGNSNGGGVWQVVECGMPYPKEAWMKSEHNPECVEHKIGEDVYTRCMYDKDKVDECKDREDDWICLKNKTYTCYQGRRISEDQSCEN